MRGNLLFKLQRFGASMAVQKLQFPKMILANSTVDIATAELPKMILVLYTNSHDKKEDYYLCWWIGKDSVEEDQKMAAKLASSMCNSLKGRPVLGRIFQGKEPPQFVAIFQPLVILKGGLSSGYKKLYCRQRSK